LLLNPSGKNTGEKIISAETNSASASTNTQNSTSGRSANLNIKDTNHNRILPAQPSKHKFVNQQSFSELSIQNSKTQAIKYDKSTANNKETLYHQSNTVENKTGIDNQITNPDNNGITEQTDISQSSTEAIIKDSTEGNRNERADENKETNSLIKENDKNTSHKKNPAPKNRNKFINSFAINFSAGPDVSAVNIDDIGKINPLFGAGISYSIGKRWNLRTGFYVEKKVYDTKADNYHPPAGFWNNYPDLNYIDANCKVYEVPLIINYNFSQASTHFWFASAGISSYFMKKEKYYYTPKDPSIQYPYDSYIVNNKNKHYFSSARLSAGYERKFSKTISVIAEPYLNLPLAGVGYGKVNLYSTGILFTLSIKPFAKK